MPYNPLLDETAASNSYNPNLSMFDEPMFEDLGGGGTGLPEYNPNINTSQTTPTSSSSPFSPSGFGNWMGHDLGSFFGLSASGIGSKLGIPASDAEQAGFYSFDPKTLRAMNPNDPMYQKQITGTQQSFMPALMRSALSTGSGVSGAAASGSGVGLGRGSRYMQGQQQERFQPYLSQLSSTMKGISSDIGAARRLGGDFLSDLMGIYRGLDFEAPPGAPVPDPITGLPGGEVPMYGDSPEITPGMYENYLTELLGEDFLSDNVYGDFEYTGGTMASYNECLASGGQWNASTQSCDSAG